MTGESNEIAGTPSRANRGIGGMARRVMKSLRIGQRHETRTRADIEAGDAARSELHFNVEMSVRYHRRRASFLERTNLLLNLAILFGGGGAFVSLFGTTTWIAKGLALFLFAAGLVQIVYKPEACAIAHKQWLARWLAILHEIKVTPDPTPQEIADWTARQYEIEAECVVEMRALQADCFNRTAGALARQFEPYRLTWMQRRLLHIRSYEPQIELENIRIRELEQRDRAEVHG